MKPKDTAKTEANTKWVRVSTAKPKIYIHKDDLIKIAKGLESMKKPTQTDTANDKEI